MEKLTIKEAGRYSNFLDKTMNSLISLSRNGIEESLYKTTELHKKSEALKDAEDDKITVEYENKVDLTVEQLTELLKSFVLEKVNLANKIAEAKKTLMVETSDGELNLDAAVETAKLFRQISNEYFVRLESLKNKKTKSTSRGYAFNVEGNQTPYVYNVEITTEIQFNKDNIVKDNKEFKAKADKISEKIEQAMSQATVEFEPKYNYLDTLEEVVANFKE